MNQRSDIDRVLQVWMADGPAAIPDRVVDVVAARIGVQRQRRTWPFQRRTIVTIQIKLIAALAAALVVAVVGYNLLPGVINPGGPSVTPVASSTPAPTAGPIRDVTGTEGILEPGPWRFRPFEDVPSLSVVAEIPAGWLPVATWGLENASATNSPPAGLAIVFEMSELGLFSDPCHWDVDGTGSVGRGDIEVGPTVAALVDALRANTSYTSSTPSPITFGPYQGQQLELRLPADLDPATCDQPSDEDEGRYFVRPDGIYSQGRANIWRLFIVDVAGTRFIANIEHFPGTAPDKLAEAVAIVNSLEFTP